ncbi:hypothetical protein UlMin_036234 [Ulmus minor]
MCIMCHHCGEGLNNSKEERKIQVNVNLLKPGKKDCIWSCKHCGFKSDQELKHSESPYRTPMISSTTALSSSDRSESNCSEMSVVVNSDRCNQEEATVNSNQENHSYRSNEQLQKLSSECSENGFDRSYSLMERHSGNEMAVDVHISQTSDNGHEGKDNDGKKTHVSFSEESEDSHSLEDKMDAHIWEPPDLDEAEDSVALDDDDDDDECGDGIKWGKPCSLSRDEGSASYSSKEEKQRAMEEVINGKFKVLVSQLLKSVGIPSQGEDGESWVDIVTSLSWEAASFLKPEAIVSKSMDPDGIVKVKCIATGLRSHSEVVKGLVFKKHAAHKHMPTNYKNPRLLLVQGVLGQSSSGLSSFDSMKQEEDYLNSISEMLDVCHPNVVLVEKTVSRDVQESILKKGMTLVFDMKLHRLKRVARCTGSPILSSDTLTSQKLKQCDSFRIEKFVEEHAGFGEGGKTPRKTLMFIEGCPTRLGCTILLKGAHSDELKRIKCVVQCAVIMAYHLILETSFIVDQRAMFSSIPFAGSAIVSPTEVANVFPANQQLGNLTSGCLYGPCLQEATSETESNKFDVPISNGFHDGGSSDLEVEGNSHLHEPYNPAVFSGFSSLSTSLKKVIGENFPIASTPYQSLSSYFGFNGKESHGQIRDSFSTSASPNALDNYEVEDKSSSDEEKSLNIEQCQSSNENSEAHQELKKDSCNDEDKMKGKNDVNRVLDSQSILVLMSRRNALRGTICEQNHFSHILFYKNFDVPLGKFLRENLLNQRSQCNVCGELPEAHFYYYAHHNKQLTARVKRRSGKPLPGEKEGELWMWSRCGKCKSGNGMSNSTKKVLVSSAARSLSFGKFLELGFSHYSSSRILCSCGHSLHKDFLYFFGWGNMVAMFKYSSVATYTVSVPPQKLQFSNSIKQEVPMKEIEKLCLKHMRLFDEVKDSLEEIKSQFEGVTLNLGGSLKRFSDIEEMLKQEKAEFEVKILRALAKNGYSDQAVYKLLNLNRFMWELLIEACIWDRRIHSLLSPEPKLIDSGSNAKAIHEQINSKLDAPAEGNVGTGEGYVGINNDANAANEFPVKENSVEGPDDESKGANISSVSSVEIQIEVVNGSNLRPNGSSHFHSDDGREENGQLSDHPHVDSTVPISIDDRQLDYVDNLDLSHTSMPEHLYISSLENRNGWFWAPLAEIIDLDMKDLQRVYLPKFEALSSYTSNHLPTAYQLITEEGQRLHIPLGSDGYIVSDYEGELSSIIARALALLKDLPLKAEAFDDGSSTTRTIESFFSLNRVLMITSSHWSSSSSSDSDSVSTSTISLDESRFSSFDGLNLLDSLVPPGNVNLIVPLGVSKSLEKGRYTIVCPYANQFRELRNRCCPSELDYIASLSRCRNWDAKGGKSKSFFAKTLDDRLIIKEIKKTEFESFMKFAGNQTCLAKVLGIYQVVVRQKNGKETRHDLMVMENLTFGRNITHQYDLKGALHARFNSSANGSGDVLLDQNFVNDMNSSPLYVSNESKRILQRAVWNDTTFPNSINVMDYSLLVGVDTQRWELVCGIIDFLRQYTWDKQLETWVKSSLVPRHLLPTVISPIEYKRRFRKFMSTHFLSVPDHWCLEKSSKECQICSARAGDSSP